MRVRIIFSFSLYAISLLVILIIYFERNNQNIVGRQVYWKVGDVLSLILEVDDSFYLIFRIRLDNITTGLYTKYAT